MPALGQTKSPGMPYLEGAACTTIPNAMDGNNYGDVMIGLEACRGCPVLAQCSNWVNGLDRYSKRHMLGGVVAGKVWGEAKRYLSVREREEHGGTVDPVRR
jgi:hypothetical protein